MKKFQKLVLKKDVITSLGKSEQANLKGGIAGRSMRSSCHS